jgi:tetratricopeptide (TPR) repeat protein
VEAALLVELGRTQEALRLLEESLQTLKGVPGTLRGRGVLLDPLGRKAEALAAFEEAISVIGDDPAILIDMARLNDELGRAVEAKTNHLRAVPLLREDPDLAIDLGYLLLRRGSRKESGPVLVTAGRESEQYFVRAATQLKEARAASEMEDLLLTNKEDVLAPDEVPLFRGALLRWKGRPEEAERMLRQGMLKAAPPNTFFFMEEVSLALSSLNRIDDALKLANQLATAEGWGAKGRFLRACALAGTRREEAAAELRDALREKSSLVVGADNEALLAPLRSDPGIQRLLDELRPRVELRK